MIIGTVIETEEGRSEFFYNKNKNIQLRAIYYTKKSYGISVHIKKQVTRQWLAWDDYTLRGTTPSDILKDWLSQEPQRPFPKILREWLLHQGVTPEEIRRQKRNAKAARKLL